MSFADPTIAAALATAAAHEDAGRAPQAERVLLEVLARDPHQAEALNRLAVLVGKAGRIDRAIELLRRAVAVDPSAAHAHYHLGIALWHHGRLTAAAESFARAITLKPDMAEPHATLGLLHLTVGDYAAGLPEYEWRTRMAAFDPPPPVPVPAWDGSPLAAGRSVLLRAEQGFGDTVQFARLASLLKARHPGCRIVLEVQPALRRLLDGFPGTDAVIAVGERPPIEVDVQVPLVSLLHRLGVRADAVPPPAEPRLRPPVGSPWRRPTDGRRWLGLVWAGSPTNTNDRNRSVPIGALAPLGDVPGVGWVGLQAGAAARDRPAAVADGLAGVHDFAGTAAVIEQLDGVVTVDTAVAHVAGSMLKPVWLMLPLMPDWRWGLGRPTTPWYPSVRLFRQPAVGAWGPVVAAIREAIHR